MTRVSEKDGTQSTQCLASEDVFLTLKKVTSPLKKFWFKIVDRPGQNKNI